MTKILIIDNDMITTDVIKLMLEPVGFEVKCVHSSVDGIKKTHHWRPDLVILDLALPSGGGWEVCKSIREFSQVPIIILSVINNTSLVVKALDEGADDFLTKPVRDEVLIAHINKLTRRSPANLSRSPPQPGIEVSSDQSLFQ